jgi:hypothetical protein
MGLQQVLNYHNLLCSLQCKKHLDLLMIMSNHRKLQKRTTDKVIFERIPGNITGAYVSLESEITRYINASIM